MSDLIGFTSTNDWFSGIGRVVVAAAELEAAVGTLLYAIDTNSTDRFYPEPIGTLIRKCKKRLPQLSERPVLRARVEDVLAEVAAIMERRNDVVHGWWRFGIDGKDALRRRALPKRPEGYFAQVTYNDLSVLYADVEATRRAVWRLAHDITGA